MQSVSIHSREGNRVKKIRVALLCTLAFILLFSLSACGKTDGGNAGSATAGSGQTSGDSGKGDTNSKKLTLKWFVNGNNNDQLPPKEKDFVKKYIDEKFNVDLQIQHMAVGTDFNNKLNLMLSGGDVPDMFMVDGASSNKYIIDGVVKDLTGWVTPERMPNYFKYWVTETELKRYQVQDVFKRAPVPFAKNQYRSYYIRKDWLDKLGLKMPETYEDMINVMKAFTFNDPDGNGKKDTYGFSLSGGGESIPMDFPEYYKNGLLAGFMLEGDQFIDAQTDIRVGKVFDDLRQTLALGVIDPDWFLQKSPEHLNKAAQGKVGIIMSGSRTEAFDNIPTSTQYKTKQITKDDKVDWQPFHPWANVGVAYEALPGNPFMFGVNTPDEKVQRSVQILDWLASPEGFILTHYGQEGVHYTKQGNTIKLNPDAYKRDITDQGNFLSIYQFFTPEEPNRVGLEVLDPRETDRDRAIQKKVMSYKYVQNIGTNVAPPAGLDIGTFRKQMRQTLAKMLFEDKDSSNWPQYRQELMTKYKGKDIFEYYADQISKAMGKKYVFKADN